MKLKALLDNLDGVDDSLKAAYTEKDGKFYLNVEGVDSLPEVEGLRNTMRRAKDEKKAAETKFDAINARLGDLPEDFDLAAYNRLKDASPGDVDKRLSDQRTQIEAQNKKVVDKLTGERDTANKKLEGTLRDAALDRAIAELGVVPSMANAVHKLKRDDIQVAIEGETPILTIDNVPVNEAMKTWIGTDEGKHFAAAAANGGGGAGPNGNKSPSDYSKKSDTELALSQDRDPQAKAEMDRRTRIEKPAAR